MRSHGVTKHTIIVALVVFACLSSLVVWWSVGSLRGELSGMHGTQVAGISNEPPGPDAKEEARRERVVLNLIAASDFAGAQSELNAMEAIFGETPFVTARRVEVLKHLNSPAVSSSFMRIVRGEVADPIDNAVYKQALEDARNRALPELVEIASYVLAKFPHTPHVYGSALDLSRSPSSDSRKIAYAFAFLAYDFLDDANEEVRLMRIAYGYDPSDPILKVYLAESIQALPSNEEREAERQVLIQQAYALASGNSALRDLIRDVADTDGIPLP